MNGTKFKGAKFVFGSLVMLSIFIVVIEKEFISKLSYSLETEKNVTRIPVGLKKEDIFYNWTVHVVKKDNIINNSNTEQLQRAIEPKLIIPGNHTNIPPPESIPGPNGEKGYVHNPKFLVENPKPFQIPDDQREKICLPPGQFHERPEGYAALRKIRHHIETSQEDRNVKLFCAVYTYKGGLNFTIAASETWAKRCDGVLFASDNTNLTTGHVRIPSNSRNKFTYLGMGQRTRAILAYLYDNFLDDYDFFHISGDDIYLIVENLKEFLASNRVKDWEKVPNQYVFAGFIMYRYNQVKIEQYLAGGPGYTLSRKALKAFVEGPMQICHTHNEGSEEDVFMSLCAELLNKNFIDTRDSVGAHRYHQLSVQIHAAFPNKKWGDDTQMIQNALEYQKKKFGHPVVYMEDYISNSSIAFHKHHLEEIRRLEILLYLNGNELCQEMFSPCSQANATAAPNSTNITACP